MNMWTPEEDATLRRMVEAGYSAGQVGMAMGKTRNSALGRASRLHLQLHGRVLAGPPRTGKTSQSNSRKAWVEQIRKDKAARMPPDGRSPPLALLPTEPQVGLPEPAMKLGHGIRLIDHHEGMCRYGYGEPRSPDFRYCGAPTEGDPSWCPTHRKRIFQVRT